MSELLGTHPVIRSTDIEEIRAAVGTAVCPHRLDPYPHSHRGVSIFNQADLGDVALCYAAHGVPVRVRHEPLDSSMLVRFTLSGSLTVRSGCADVPFDRRVATVFNPDTAYDISIDSGARALVLRVERSALQAELRRIMGHPPSRRVCFAPSLDMARPQARSWLSLLRTLCADLDGPRTMTHPALRQPVQRLVIAQLLTTVQHSFSDEVSGIDSGEADSVTARMVRRADQIIDDHCREPLTVSDIAEAVGTSVRSLQSGFRQHLNTTPIERLRQARLAGVHAELRASDPSRVSVSNIAAEWGFGHLGRFSERYRIAFGEKPSQTLRS